VAELWIASDCPDTDFTVKLIDWYPPNVDYPAGYALNVADGILRVRYRDSWEAPAPLERGRPVLIRVEPFPSSNLFRAGHRTLEVGEGAVGAAQQFAQCGDAGLPSRGQVALDQRLAGQHQHRRGGAHRRGRTGSSTRDGRSPSTNTVLRARRVPLHRPSGSPVFGFRSKCG
jgi:hypothetical protein